MMIPVGPGPKAKALTLIEVMVIIAILGLVLICLLPLMTGNRYATTLQCLSNTKQNVLAMRMWSNDHGELLPHRVPATEGGLKNPGTNQIQIPGIGTFDPHLRTNAWLYFLLLHPELNTPKVLFCRADKNLAKRATTWTNGPQGLVSPQFQNNAVSYAIGLDADLNPNGGPPDFVDGPKHIILSDRHLSHNGADNSCSAGIGLTKVIKHTRQGTNVVVDVAWNKKPKGHEGRGVVGLLDGSADEMTSKQIQDLLATQPSDNGELHFIYP